MRNQTLLTISICLLFNFSGLAGGPLNSVDQEALGETQKLLEDGPERQKFIDGNKDAQKTDQMVDQLVTSPEQKEEMYKLASEIFGDLVKDQGGDAEAMKKVLQKGAADPESFMRGLSSEHKAVIQKMVSDIEATSGKVPSK